MKQLLVLVAVALATVIANPVTVDHNKFGNIINAKLGLHAVASSNIDANVFSALLAAVNQQAAISATGAASGDEKDKVALLKDMLKKKIDLPTLEAATSGQRSPMSRTEMFKRVQEKVAEMKQKATESIKTPAVPTIADHLARLPEKYAGRMKDIKLPENFKIPEGIQLPEKFMHRMKEIKQL